MDAKTFNEHEIFKKISSLTNELNNLIPSEKQNIYQKDILKKINHLEWCLVQSDHELISERELSKIFNNLDMADQHKHCFQNAQRHRVDDPITNALKDFPGPRNKKQRRSDSSALFRELENKINELQDWQKIKKVEFESLTKLHQENFEEIKKNHDAQYSKWVIKGIRKFKVWRGRLDTNVTEQKGYVDKKISESEDKLKKLEELFLKKLKLEAPTKYWKDKAKQHKNIAWISSIVFIIVITLSLIAFIKIGWPAMGEIIKELAAQKNLGIAALLPVSLLLVPTLSVAWILRHISRLIIQNFSLAEDAEVRRNIALTFLAITKDKENVDAEMALVLQALFRPLDGSGHADIPPPQLDEVIKLVRR